MIQNWTSTDWHELQQDIERKTLLVIGDVMLDVYVEGTVHRNSPEAPVPVLSMSETYNCVGGAANVALNLHKLGAKVHLCSVIGADHEGAKLAALLDEHTITHTLVKESDRRTTVKQRFMREATHLLRVDTEDTHDISEATVTDLDGIVMGQVASCTGIVISDYDKGVMSVALIKRVLRIATLYNIPVYVDPKHRNFWEYTGCTIFKPNISELSKALGSNRSMDSMLQVATKRLGGADIICTAAEQGMSYLNNGHLTKVPARQVQVADVSGAGDTALAVIVLGHQCGLSTQLICELAITASGIVCTKKGVATVTWPEIAK